MSPDTMLTTPEPTTVIEWHKSSYSAPGNDCVEIAQLPQDGPHPIACRDSKDPDRAYLRYSATDWNVFVRAVADGTI